MPKRRPTYLPGCYYHFYNRGALRASMFRSAEDYLFVIRRMKQYSQMLSLAVIAYCLLPNHYHWLVRQDGDQRAGAFPQRVFNSYVKAFNARHERTGTLFEGPYQVVPVQQEAHLLHLCRYVHGNPVRHGLVSHSAEWPFSNYREWTNQRSGTMIDREFFSRWFDGPERYEAFVLEYLDGGRETGEGVG